MENSTKRLIRSHNQGGEHSGLLNAKNTMAWSYRKNARHRNPPKKMLYGKLYATRRRGRPKIRWLDDVFMDLRKMDVNEWRDRARNRETWRRIVEEVKVHPGL